MGRPSSIDKLDPEIRRRLIDLLDDPNVTQQAIADIINAEVGKPIVSKSAVNRYAQRMHQFTERNRQAREVAELYLSQFADERRNTLGKVLNEQIRMVAFDLLVNLKDPAADDLSPDDRKGLVELINKLSRSVRDLEQAAKINTEHEAAIRAGAIEQAADQAVGAAREAGLSDEGVAEIRTRILGLLDG